MKLWPSDSIEIDTPMSAEAALAALEAQTESARWPRMLSGGKSFQGSISPDGFTITRIIHYRNSFLPVITGTVRPGPAGSTVAVKMRLPSFAIVFLCIWSGINVASILAPLLGSGADARSAWLTPLVLLLFAWVLASGGFWFEARRARTILIDTLHGALKPS